MKKLLIISRYCPYDTAPYAGSKTHNFYLKRLHRDFDVKLITFAEPNEKLLLDLGKYGIDNDVSFVNGGVSNIPRMLLHNWWNAPNYFGTTLGLINGYLRHLLMKKLRALKIRNYVPDIILLEWTQTLLMVGRIRKLFPNALYVASEHDVTFLRLRRQLDSARGLARLKERLRYESLKKAELSALRLVDLVAPHSSADRDQLIHLGLSKDKIHVIAPYISEFPNVTYNPIGKQILFYGAMDREDNYKSVIWFMDTVLFPLLPSSYTLCILGARPHQTLNKYKSSRVTITGFVPDIREYFENSLCMVAPLLCGAGIKVKVIEAMGAGLPVLANRIAIEGIPAKNGIEYLHCEQPSDFKSAFENIAEGTIDLLTISENARKCVTSAFNLDSSYASYKECILGRFEQTAVQRKGRS
jgi:glycosyltransferase involved in cell wall biosynthesis